MLIRCFVILWRRKRDSNPRNSYPFTAFRVRPVRPLRHFSSDWSTAKLLRIFLPAKARCQKKKKPNGHEKKEFALWRRKSVRAERKQSYPRAKEWGRCMDFLQCLQNFLNALQKFLQALQIFAECVSVFRCAIKADFSPSGKSCNLSVA